MHILILGGTRFLGRYIVEVSLAHGHEVTLLHRGQTGPGLFEGQVERLLGDRTQDLSALSGRTWDAVIDTCGYVPRIVGLSAGKIAGERLAPRYLFVSSISVYADPIAGAGDQAGKETEQRLHFSD
jgi:2'-hydroxyisoflavone reductase